MIESRSLHVWLWTQLSTNRRWHPTSTNTIGSLLVVTLFREHLKHLAKNCSGHGRSFKKQWPNFHLWKRTCRCDIGHDLLEIVTREPKVYTRQMQLTTQAEKRYDITSRPMATGELLQQNGLSFRLKVMLWISSTVPCQPMFVGGRNH